MGGKLQRRPLIMQSSDPEQGGKRREKTGVNHYRQYRLKMQSPPGAQGHWRPMGGRTLFCNTPPHHHHHHHPPSSSPPPLPPPFLFLFFTLLNNHLHLTAYLLSSSFFCAHARSKKSAWVSHAEEETKLGRERGEREREREREEKRE
ncbi:hypothetical protein INR49_001073 [Caranx melampygus]|nr:hypothetical protein INR49_001073 [Caranx melampygus]